MLAAFANAESPIMFFLRCLRQAGGEVLGGGHGEIDGLFHQPRRFGARLVIAECATSRARLGGDTFRRDHLQRSARVAVVRLFYSSPAAFGEFAQNTVTLLNTLKSTLVIPLQQEISGMCGMSPVANLICPGIVAEPPSRRSKLVFPVGKTLKPSKSSCADDP